jgi:TetR/AcrR family transcriptional regulator, regulator of autoinduction and epiphytic fitness
MSADSATRPNRPARPADGRMARSHQTIEHIVGALLELVERDGHMRPTAYQVARRAGVSRRGLYLHFDTIEDVFATAAERRARQVEAAWRPPPAEAPLDERIVRFCRRWASLLEVLNPVRRAAAIHEPSSHRMAATADRTRRWAGAAVEQAFSPELASLPREERPEVVTALHRATSWCAWEDLRRDGCDVQQAAEAMRHLLTALLRRGY